MGKKGKGKKQGGEGSVDSQPNAGGSATDQSQPAGRGRGLAQEGPSPPTIGRGRGQPLHQPIAVVGAPVCPALAPVAPVQVEIPQLRPQQPPAEMPAAQAAGEPQGQPEPQQGKKGKKGKQKQQQPTEVVQPQLQPPAEMPAAQPADEPQGQPEPQQGKKGKKGKQKQQQPTEVVQPQPQPAAEMPAAQPAGEPQGQLEPQQGKKGKKGKQKQQQPTEVIQPQPQVQVPITPQPADVAQTAEMQPSARGRGRAAPQQQQPQPPGAPLGRGQAPLQQQQPQLPGAPLGRGQAPPQQQQPQPPGAPWGRGQAPPQQQQQQPPGAPWGRGQAPPHQQQPQLSGAPWSRGQVQAPQPQEPGGPWGRGQAPTQQQQPRAMGRGQQQQQPAGRGAGRGPPGPGRERRTSEASDSSSGSARRPQQTLEAAMQQMHIPGAGDQPVPPHLQQKVRQQQQQRPPQQQEYQQPRSPPQQQQRPKQQQEQQQAPPEFQTPKQWDLAIPRRKDLRKGGTRGQPIQVQTNHLALEINPKFETAIHYDVAITPDRPKRMMRPVWEAFHKQYLHKYAIAFDDVKNAYSPSMLPDNVSGEVQVPEDEVSQPKTYKVVVKFAAEVNLRALFSYMASGCVTAVPQDALQCIDIVLRNASALRFVRVGRSYFSEPVGQIVSLGDGLELWHGFFQSAVIGWKPFLNVDVAHKGFPKPQPVIGLFAEMTQQREAIQLGVEDTDKISKFMKSLKIMYEIPGQSASRRTYRVNGLVNTPDAAMFVQDEKSISVLNYYLEQKGYDIRHRNLPCLWVGPRERRIYLPPELCTIVAGQVFNRKLNEIQTSTMVRNAATSTDRRKQKIMDSLNGVRFNDDPVVRAFGLRVGRDFERINARWLAPPALEYRNRPIRPAKGVWRAAEFLQAQQLPNGSWFIINLDRRTRDDSINMFVRLMQQTAPSLGMEVGTPEQPYTRMERFDQRQFESTLQRNKQKKLVFVIVPDFPTNIYSKVKQAAELKVGCLTQCIKARTMFRSMNPATVGNILLKVNAKLNGQNHTITSEYRPPCLQVPCMIMGADVTHPSPDQTDIPSVAAVTASCDPRAFQYNFSWRLQPARQEIITDLEAIVREQLMYFRTKCNQVPRRLIFFRDGVSEGQFQEVMNMEVAAIRRACSSLGSPGSYKPPITFVVVQKRHHTRFFPSSSAESEDRNMNVRAGTVVDTYITHPTDLEYYLVSHASIQGVARPTKYRVLWDDSNMSEDELEALTYYLCHMFSRCTRSVSYPAPTYYAHLAAFRARVYLEGHRINLDNLPQEQALRIIRDEILRGQPMFFV